ncbi:TPA: translation initiation factor IF-2 subunit alpha [Candidatus Woesearchaeota archaeon]|nr:translation initiation factor IF-2 subunit alpha [Candidatus Woesearchaeota archaeon]
MVEKKKDFPEESDLVLCTVTKIYPHCVFANLDEFDRKQGMIHISEISPGRIRNIHDYVKIGKKIICKVLSINMEKGHIDLSLRRVSEGQKREKAELIKRQQKAEKIIEFVAGKLKTDKQKLQDDLVSKLGDEYPSLHDAFEEFIVDESVLSKLGLPKAFYDNLAEVIRQRIKPPEVEIDGEIKLKSNAPAGVNVVKKILCDAEKLDESLTIRYNGGGSYSINVVYDNYKDAEKILKKATDLMEGEAKKNECDYSFRRIEKKKKAAA